MGNLDWPVLLIPENESSAQLRVVSRHLAPAAAPYTFTSIPSSLDQFVFTNLASVTPIGTDGTGSWVLALKMNDGTLKIQTVSSTGSTTSSSSAWNRTLSYFSSPNATAHFVFPSKGLGFASTNAAPATPNTDDTLVIVAEPYQITP